MKDLTAAQVAQRLGVGKSTIHYWITEGYFPNAYKINPYAKNSPRRIPENDVADFERKRKATTY